MSRSSDALCAAPWAEDGEFSRESAPVRPLVGEVKRESAESGGTAVHAKARLREWPGFRCNSVWAKR